MVDRAQPMGVGNAVFDEAFDESPIGMSIVGIDGTRLRVNAALCNLLGVTEAEYLQATGDDAFAQAQDLAGDRELVASLLRGERTSYTRELQYRHRDGSVVHGRLSVGLIRDREGTPLHFVVQVEDRTDAVRAVELLEAVVANMSDQVLVLDEDGDITWASPSFRRLVDREELIGSKFTADVHPDDRTVVRDALRDLAAGTVEGPVERTLRVWSVAHTGWRWLETTVTDHRRNSSINGVLVCGRDITTRIEQTEELRTQAVHDPLTGLPNRALLYDRLEGASTRASRYGMRFAVLFFDLDHFKDVNDTLGHAAGDALLVEVARRTRSRLRTADTLARLGGDEFVIVLERLRPGSEQEVIDRICSDLLTSLAEPVDLGERHYRVTSSIGVVVSSGEESPAELLRAADVAMYAAKAAGRGRWVHHTDELTISARDEFEIRERIIHALDHHDIRVHYQPIVEVATGRCIAVEALARLQDVHGHSIPPDTFIPIAERTGLISSLGDQVLRRSTADLAACADTSLRLAVNIAGQQLADPEFEVQVMEALAHSGLAPERLVLEVTESGVLDTRNPTVVRTIHRFRDHGISFSLDDFGRGFSSLERLRNLPISQLKLDRAFVAGVTTIGSGDIAVIRAVMGIAASLEIPIIAEGVENDLQWQILQRLGVEYAQGYLFGRPSPDLDPGNTLVSRT